MDVIPSSCPAPSLTDPATFDRVVEAAGPPALLLAIEARMGPKLLGQMSAEDIWQETLLQAWKDRERHEWRGLSCFRNWLLALATNRIRDAVDWASAQKRGGGVEPSHLFDAGESSVSNDSWLLVSTTPSRIATHREQANAMQKALEALPDRLREVVRLRIFEELPLQRISAELSLSPAAVKHRLREGSALYRSNLRRAFPDEDANPSKP